jgi:hypothetical protein
MQMLYLGLNFKHARYFCEIQLTSFPCQFVHSETGGKIFRDVPMCSFEMWCWRRMEKISWTDRIRNEVLLTVKE